MLQFLNLLKFKCIDKKIILFQKIRLEISSNDFATRQEDVLCQNNVLYFPDKILFIRSKGSILASIPVKSIFTKQNCRETYRPRNQKKSEKALSREEKVAFVKQFVSAQGEMEACFVLNFGFDGQLPWPQVQSSPYRVWLLNFLKNGMFF